jgi:hypothetical protein
MLGMPKHDKEWHMQDIADEIRELKESRSLIYRWSESSDIVYTVTRAWWSGYPDIQSPITGVSFYLAALYMIPKYSLRRLFFRKVGRRMNSSKPVTEVRNPRKTHKLVNIAGYYQLDPNKFVAECNRLLRFWPLLP